MSPRLQIIIGAIIILALIYIAHTIKKNAIDIKYALIWFVVGAILLVFDLFPGLLSFVTKEMGIELPVNMLFFMGFCLSILIIFMLSVYISKLMEQVKKLTQEIALIKEKMNKDENEKKTF